MKKQPLHLLTFFIFLISISLTQAQTIYVNADAAGAGDGSSWMDAFTDLSEAIDSADTGNEIWVAAGTYYPGGASPDSSSFFVLKNDVALYGGFAGTETMLSERDYENNVTTLSGDLLNNDMPENTSDNREDNVMHVFFLDETITNTAVLDGFMVMGGHAKDTPAGGDTRRGGAILTYGAPTIRNCTFTNNYGYFAAAVYPRGGDASGVIIDNCLFDYNVGRTGGAMYTVGLTSGTISNTTFSNNSTEVDQRGGAIYVQSSSVDITNCDFTSNTCFRTGGALHIQGFDDTVTVNVTDCNFTNNSATWGGAITTYSEFTSVNVSRCTFSNNTAQTAGGAMSNGFKAIATIDSSEFINNSSDNVGGAIFNQNDTTELHVSNSAFRTNSAVNNGGAIQVGGISPCSFTNCDFETNQGDFGGAINYSGGLALLSTLDITDCIFIANIAQSQGGGVSVVNATTRITNSLFDTNIANNVGTGGAISNNGSGEQNSTVSVLNCTFANNFGALAAGISQWTDSDTSFATLVLQNNIFNNVDGFNYAIEDGFPTVISNGGNLSGDDTMDGDLIGTNDLTSTDPLFVDLYNSDFHLTAGSPCINSGIADGAPPFDIEGNPRVGEVDMGAYEFQEVVSTVELVDNSKLKLSPNPAGATTLLQLENEWRGPLQLRIYDNIGKLVAVRILLKNSQEFSQQVNLDELSTGAYRLVLIGGKEMMSKSLIKL